MQWHPTDGGTHGSTKIPNQLSAMTRRSASALPAGQQRTEVIDRRVVSGLTDLRRRRAIGVIDAAIVIGYERLTVEIIGLERVCLDRLTPHPLAERPCYRAFHNMNRCERRKGKAE